MRGNNRQRTMARKDIEKEDESPGEAFESEEFDDALFEGLEATSD